MSDTYFLIIGIILAAIGAGCLAMRIKRRISCSMKVSAVVASMQKKKSNYWRGKTFYQYFPTFSYQIQGESYTVKCMHPVKRAGTCQKGDTVVIRCNPKAPEDICTGGNVLACIGDFLLLAFGTLLIVCYFL